jgi:hypothetical protein
MTSTPPAHHIHDCADLAGHIAERRLHGHRLRPEPADLSHRRLSDRPHGRFPVPHIREGFPCPNHHP